MSATWQWAKANPDAAARRIRELERENAALRELTSTLGAPNHINIPVEKWHELRKDKERLEWVIKDSYYHFFFKLSSDLEKGRRQIDAARKEAQP
jgi:plasmid stabilization system protein ParE